MEYALAKLIDARNRLRDAIVKLRGGHSSRVDDCDEALASLDIAIGLTGLRSTDARRAEVSSLAPPKWFVRCQAAGHAVSIQDDGEYFCSDCSRGERKKAP